MARDPLGTAREVADYINKSEKTLANWRWSGIGPPYIKAEGGILYRWSEVEKWLTAQRVEPSRPVPA